MEKSSSKYNADNCLMLVDSLIYSCFTVPTNNYKNTCNTRIDFALGSKLLGLWCSYMDLSEAKLRKTIIRFNSKLREELDEKKRKAIRNRVILLGLDE